MLFMLGTDRRAPKAASPVFDQVITISHHVPSHRRMYNGTTFHTMLIERSDVFRIFPHTRPFATHVRATVKWYNPTKGFGFVTPNDGSPDVFLHVSVVEQAGLQSLDEGAILVCDLADGQKGAQVSTIHSVEAGSAQRSGRRQTDPVPPSERQRLR